MEPSEKPELSLEPMLGFRKQTLVRRAPSERAQIAEAGQKTRKNLLAQFPDCVFVNCLSKIVRKVIILVN
jgi:hypothetical protein